MNLKQRIFGNITIQPHGEGSWQAFVPVLDARLAGVPGVYGSANRDGPWIGGTGKTPEAALAELKTAIGSIVLSTCALVENSVAEGERQTKGQGT